MKIRIKQVGQFRVPLPAYQTDGAAALDLHAAEHKMVMPGTTARIETGIQVEIPNGCVMLVTPRSGLALNRGITVANAPGVIDSDYRGEVSVILHNRSSEIFHVTAGDRIAQAFVLPLPRVEWEVVRELSETSRGEGGFGSTG